jgi:type IV secretion system protein VirB3
MNRPAALEEDTLFLACTRPAMIAGVTMEAMAINVMLTTIIFIMGGIGFVLLGIINHLIFKAIMKYDHNMFRILLAWLDTRGRSFNSAYWGGSSPTPLRIIRHYDERDLSLG